MHILDEMYHQHDDCYTLVALILKKNPRFTQCGGE